jgi:arsenate reductase-like glutaredoxin family protein
VKAQERDFFQRRFTREELDNLLGDRVAEAFSLKSPSVKALGLEGKQLSRDAMLDWMVREPRLIRRPILIVDGRMLFGYRLGEVEQALRQ